MGRQALGSRKGYKWRLDRPCGPAGSRHLWLQLYGRRPSNDRSRELAGQTDALASNQYARSSGGADNDLGVRSRDPSRRSSAAFLFFKGFAKETQLARLHTAGIRAKTIGKYPVFFLFHGAG